MFSGAQRTWLANAIPRIFMDDTYEDRAALRPLVNQVLAYPLEEYTGQMRMKDWANVPSFEARDSDGGGETKWVRPETFFEQLGEVLATVSPLPGEEAIYAQFSALRAAGERDPQIRELIEAAFLAADESFVQQTMKREYNGKDAGNGWNRSVNNSQWGSISKVVPRLHARTCLKIAPMKHSIFTPTTILRELAWRVSSRTR